MASSGPAVAAAGDGTVTVKVVQDVNANGVVDPVALEPALSGVTVTLTDAAGHTQTGTTDDTGSAVIDPTTGPLIGGKYRVDVTNPRPGQFFPAFAANGQSIAAIPVTPADLTSPTNIKLSTATEFVDVSGGTNAYVNTAFWFPDYYCQNNATVIAACLPHSTPETSTDDQKSLFSTAYRVSAGATLTPDATLGQTGALYGIAYSKTRQKVFSAAVAHRGSAYGPSGPGGIYMMSKDGGDLAPWAVVPNVGPDNHQMGTNQDYPFFDRVGKESLGELEITHDGKYLFVTNLTDQKIYVYDANSDGTLLGSYAIPNPCAVPSDWRPYGEGIGLDTSYVGGVCSAQSTQDINDLRAVVYAFDPATGTFGSIVVDQPLAYGRGTVFLGAALCDGNEPPADPGYWHPWIADFPAQCLIVPSGTFAYPQPILGDIVEDTNGDLIIGFRDRMTDQTGLLTVNKGSDGTYSPLGGAASGGDLVRGCKRTDGTFVLDPNLQASDTLAPGSVCTNNNVPGGNTAGQSTTYREYYTGDYRTPYHREAMFSGIALSRVETTLDSSAIDADGQVNTNGIASVNRDGTANNRGVRTDNGSDQFAKASGLADLEVLCDQAPIQIGNRVWLDSNGNGVQDAGEPPIAGVTVRLYTTAGALLGTTVTNANGTYLFDGSSFSGGLQPNTQYTIRIDSPSDYAPGGPLHDLPPTTANVGDPEHDSDGVVPPGGTYPETTITLGGPGEDNHTYDFGFNDAPAATIEKYDTVGGSVDGDADTAGTARSYSPGESRTIRFDMTNSGRKALSNVVVTDRTVTGGAVTAMSCTFPGAADATAGAFLDGTWTVAWADSQGNPPASTWAPGVTFTCTATLTMNGDSAPHADRATVDATDAVTGQPVSVADSYDAFTGSVQLVKYDGRGNFVPTQDNGIPQKPLVDGAVRDANTAADAVDYVVVPATGTTATQPVSWAVTNTGTTWLADIAIADDTLDGPAVQDVSCDFSPVGGPTTGTTWAGPWAPKTTFYCQGTLALSATGADSTHGDLAKVGSTVVAPAVNPDYDPTDPTSNPFTDQPRLDGQGNPVRSDIQLTDDDPFHAKAIIPNAGLVKGDGSAASATITHDADAMTDGQAYAPGETRDVVINLVNDGQAPLYNVTVTDALTSGDTTIQALACLFPGDPAPTAGTLAGTTWTVNWLGTYQSANAQAAWQPGVTFSCTATLTMAGGAEPHVDTATVTTNLSPVGTPGDADNPPPARPDGPTSSNPYNAYTGQIQVIKYDGTKPDPAVGSGPSTWTPPAKPLTDPAQDANTGATGVDYPIGAPQPVRWVVSNTGRTWLTAITLADTTTGGPDVGAWTCDLTAVGGPAAYSFATSGPWAGPLAPGASFFCQGPLTLPENTKHADTVAVDGTVVQPAYDADGQPLLDPNGVPRYAVDAGGNPVASSIVVTDTDPFNAQTVKVSIAKGDGVGGQITNDADSSTTGQGYSPAGESRTIVSIATNRSPVALHDVALTDVTTTGPPPTALSCAFPDETRADGVFDEATATWTIRWDATFAPGTTTWAPDATITCTSTLALDGSSATHRNVATVTAVSPAGTPLTDSNPYVAFSGRIQVVKYDGNGADPLVGSAATGWIVPVKPLSDTGKDANDADHVVEYPVGEPQPVHWLVTNTGTTWLTGIGLTDTTTMGPPVGDWTCDLSGVGGPAAYSFTTSGPWAGPLAPGASFLCQGPLTLPENTLHTDTVDVVGTVVRPLLGEDGTPVLDGNGVPRYVTDAAGQPVPSDLVVTDDDPFNAQTVSVTIVKGDGANGQIVNDADTTATGAVYASEGETRQVLSIATNPSKAPLHNVTITDVTTAGTPPLAMSCTFPDGSSADGTWDQASMTWTVPWAATFAPGTATWDPAGTIGCTSTLTLDGLAEPHQDVATVDALTPAGHPVTSSNPYNAFSGSIQVIKYDGNRPDPSVGVPGAWVVPGKPLTDPSQDANDPDHAVSYPLNSAGTSGAQKVRWVVTNTGQTWLTNVTVADVTSIGPSLDSSSVACTFPDGSTAGLIDGSVTWVNPKGVLFEPGASFFCQGLLSMPSAAVHQDTVTAQGTIVPPAPGPDGTPTDQPLLDGSGQPVLATDAAGAPWTVVDSDPFNAKTPSAPAPVTPPAAPIQGGLINSGNGTLGMGTDSGGAVAIGVGVLLLGLGLGLVLVVRRRRGATGDGGSPPAA